MKTNYLQESAVAIKGLAVVLMLCIATGAGAATVSLVPTTTTTDVVPGDVISFDVVIDFSDVGGTLGGGFDVTFDPASLGFISVDVAELGDPGVRRVPDILAGKLESWAAGEFLNGISVAGAEHVGTVTFEVLATADPVTVVSVTSTNGVAGPWVGLVDPLAIISPDYNQISISVFGVGPSDDDLDDDGLLNDQEDGSSCPGGYATDSLLADTDGDGLLDGTECGLLQPQGSDTDLSIFIADTDSSTTTIPIDDDTDDDGLLDGTEDANANGAVDAGETDPYDADTDDDGIQDGTESGLSAPEGTDTDLTVFVPDADPTTSTDPNNDDTDGDGLADGVEDANQNGRLDAGETDPLTPETPPPPPDVNCLEAATTVIGTARDYVKATRDVQQKCGRRTSDECATTLQAQIDSFAMLGESQTVMQQVCQP